MAQLSITGSAPLPILLSTSYQIYCSHQAWQTGQDAVHVSGVTTLCVANAQSARDGRRAVHREHASRETQVGVYTADTLAGSHYATLHGSSPGLIRLVGDDSLHQQRSL